MREEQSPPPLGELDAKIREAQARRSKTQKSDQTGGQKGDLGFALRIGVELVAALAVGVVIGLLLDRWLDTTPWLLLLFFLLGSAAGIMNVFRLMQGYGYAVGYRKVERTDQPSDSDPGGTRPEDGRDPKA